jgi:hypothetical protein
MHSCLHSAPQTGSGTMSYIGIGPFRIMFHSTAIFSRELLHMSQMVADSSTFLSSKTYREFRIDGSV